MKAVRLHARGGPEQIVYEEVPTGLLIGLTAPINAIEAAAYNRRGVFFIVEPNRKQLVEIAGLIDSGAIRPILAHTLTIDRAGDAFEQGARGHNRGKITLQVIKEQ